MHQNAHEQDQRGTYIACNESGQGRHGSRCYEGNSDSIKRTKHKPEITVSFELETITRPPRRFSRHKSAVLAVMAGVALSSCSTGMATPPVSSDADPEPMVISTTTLPPEPATSTTASPTVVTPRPSSAAAIVTKSGVVVAVLDHVGSVYTVRTPCGNDAKVAFGTPLPPVQVVLDPGHGGAADPGAVGANGLKEATVNLRVGRAAAKLLEARGIATALTRTADYASTLGVRAALADHVNAELLVSIHHNAPTANLGNEPGTEIFVQSDSADSRRLGKLVYEHIVDGLAEFDDVTWSIAPDAGVLEVLNTRGTDAYGMLRNPETVSALAEFAYISHRPEAELLATAEYLEVASQSLADAIEEYLIGDGQGRGYVATPRVFTPQRGLASSACVDPDLG